MGVVNMAWMYLSPVVYGIDFVPEHWRTWYLLNPMTPILLAYRDILYHQISPNDRLLLLALGMSLVILLLGMYLFSRLQKRFAEVL